jgi:plastocyanin
MRDIFKNARPLALIAVLLTLGLGIAACGDDEEDSSGASGGGGAYGSGAAETTETETETTTEETTAPSGEAPKAANVEIVDFTFGPETTTVRVGGKVNWANEDTAPHTATAQDGSFDTGTIDADKRGNATFKEAGTFAYFCEFHPYMKGTVEVVE